MDSSDRAPATSSSHIRETDGRFVSNEADGTKDGPSAAGQAVIKWTIWLLLGAILVGTILGTVLVSVPLQRSAHAPGKLFKPQKAC